MITNISIMRGEKEQFFAVGGKLVSNKKETDIDVTKIKLSFGKVKIHFSDNTSLIFKGFPYSYANGQRAKWSIRRILKNITKRA